MKTESMLMKINIEGKKYHLILMDGSKWFVNPADLPTIATWIPTTSIKIEDSRDDSIFSYKLTNLSEDISIYAMKIN
ncbi:MAG: hypothetical protein STSR0008_20890 [Ignavibacterium sp.]